ncbi:MAG: hypothetical protein ACLU8J_06085 [Acutalibacter sp.]
MPVDEKPPASPGDIYCWKKTKKEVPLRRGNSLEKGCGKFPGFVRKPVENTLGGLKNPGNMREKFSTDFLGHVENLLCGP